MNESKSKCDRISLKRESCETVSIDKIKEKFKTSQGKLNGLFVF